MSAHHDHIGRPRSRRVTGQAHDIGRQKRQRAAELDAVEEIVLDTDVLARDLVCRGLASVDILDTRRDRLAFGAAPVEVVNA